MKIYKRHFDRAVKQAWSKDTCILAQCALDNSSTLLSKIGVLTVIGKELYKNNKSHRIMSIFDHYFWNPGDEKKRELQELRESLPTSIDKS